MATCELFIDNNCQIQIPIQTQIHFIEAVARRLNIKKLNKQ